MPTLHIEHAITDFDQWKAAFDRFADFRADQGVRAHRIQQPIDDPAYVLIDLDFDRADQAEAVATYLREHVWSSSETAPALVGTPTTRILQQVASGPDSSGSPAVPDVRAAISVR